MQPTTDDLSFIEEDYDDDAWDALIDAAFEQAEETGQSFDHVMGEILGGMY